MREQQDTASESTRGPQGYENWRCQIRGLRPQFGDETPLYSDAHMTGEVTDGWGPYQALNTIGAPYHSKCLPVLVLRTTYHYEGNQTPDMDKTDTSSYHGGGAAEEIASLIGLSLGVRLRASGKTRDITFDPPNERPRAEDPAAVPLLAHDPSRPPTLPGMRKTVRLTEELLASYPNLPPASAVALARAARLYQHGLWLSESNPNDAWLMLVSAVEVAAIRWRSAESGDNAERLFRELKPKWAARLDRTGDASLVGEMANEWSHLIGATNRFLNFLKEHLPAAPEPRPTWSQVEWTTKNLRNALDKIYSLRSEALHGGIPFPVPMCRPPTALSNENPTPSEKPIGLASASWGGVWQAEDCPMHLHIFAYIVREALLKWWAGMKPTQVDSEQGKGDDLNAKVRA